jgi:hypothetical protein
MGSKTRLAIANRGLANLMGIFQCVSVQGVFSYYELVMLFPNMVCLTVEAPPAIIDLPTSPQPSPSPLNWLHHPLICTTSPQSTSSPLNLPPLHPRPSYAFIHLLSPSPRLWSTCGPTTENQ